MNISTIGLNYCVNKSTANNNIPKQSKPTYTVQCDTFTPGFKGFRETLINQAKNPYKTEAMAEKGFDILFSELRKDKTLSKKEGFQTIADIYDRKGFRGLLHELWKTNTSEEVKKAVPPKEECFRPIAETESKEIMEIVNIGKHGFSEKPTSPNNVELWFTLKDADPTTTVHFGMEKDGGILTCQNHQGRSIISRFHIQTGNLKKKIVHYCGTKVTYYNKDGSENWLKNWILGGSF